jgi:hypothetical protein
VSIGTAVKVLGPEGAPGLTSGAASTAEFLLREYDLKEPGIVNATVISLTNAVEWTH